MCSAQQVAGKHNQLATGTIRTIKYFGFVHLFLVSLTALSVSHTTHRGSNDGIINEW